MFAIHMYLSWYKLVFLITSVIADTAKLLIMILRCSLDSKPPGSPSVLSHLQTFQSISTKTDFYSVLLNIGFLPNVVIFSFLPYVHLLSHLDISKPN